MEDLQKSPLRASTPSGLRAKALRDAYNWFEALYREAADRLRDGDRDVEFRFGRL